MYEDLTDGELLVLSREQSEAFTELYRRHAESVLRYFARRTLEPETAAELTAETFAEAFASRASYRERGHGGAAWIYGVARHQLGRYFRSGAVDRRARRKLGMPERELSDEDYERIEELIDLEPLRRTLGTALEGLPEQQRECVRLRVIEERPYEEVARMLDCTQETARARVSRGLRKLALVLEPRKDERAPIEALKSPKHRARPELAAEVER